MRRTIVQALKLCRLYERAGVHPGHEPRITPAYSLAPSGETNVVQDSTGDTAQRNTDGERERREHVERVHRALEALTPMEREVVRLKYLEGMTMIEVCEALAISERTAHKSKAAALLKLAIVFGLLTPEEERQAAGML
ncbi:RNA polymerase, sigma-24 subunit, ECF subfamily [Kyrpidia tusciae DSM 2912]|uniref:RNA polymerase, sigma-24 subunit, ECF subfamily n=1 Tax=Kyrpidia tusciae (strain DSM 2912 / NBRC 15312 / T2) TaxID=562970 RepID=D5WQN2_KYRT2|nr:RNA polymerase, sigma-24 subunit, ECF subfamily [Kyrpidia tusciae DSM 2912]